MKVADREVTFLTSEEIERFFAAIVRKTIQGKRDYAIAECIYSTGLRISELTALNRSDVNFETLESLCVGSEASSVSSTSPKQLGMRYWNTSVL